MICYLCYYKSTCCKSLTTHNEKNLLDATSIKQLLGVDLSFHTAHNQTCTVNGYLDNMHKTITAHMWKLYESHFMKSPMFVTYSSVIFKRFHTE